MSGQMMSSAGAAMCSRSAEMVQCLVIRSTSAPAARVCCQQIQQQLPQPLRQPCGWLPPEPMRGQRSPLASLVQPKGKICSRMRDESGDLGCTAFHQQEQDTQPSTGTHLLMALTLELIQARLRLDPALQPGICDAQPCWECALRGCGLQHCSTEVPGMAKGLHRSTFDDHIHSASSQYITAPEVSSDRQPVLRTDSVSTVRLRLRRGHLHDPVQVSWYRNWSFPRAPARRGWRAAACTLTPMLACAASMAGCFSRCMSPRRHGAAVILRPCLPAAMVLLCHKNPTWRARTPPCRAAAPGGRAARRRPVPAAGPRHPDAQTSAAGPPLQPAPRRPCWHL